MLIDERVHVSSFWDAKVGELEQRSDLVSFVDVKMDGPTDGCVSEWSTHHRRIGTYSSFELVAVANGKVIQRWRAFYALTLHAYICHPQYYCPTLSSEERCIHAYPTKLSPMGPTGRSSLWPIRSQYHVTSVGAYFERSLISSTGIVVVSLFFKCERRLILEDNVCMAASPISSIDGK